MSHTSARSLRAVLSVVLAVLACPAFPALASAIDVTVRVEGRTGTLVGPTRVTIGNGSGWARTYSGSGSMPNRCADDTAYQATEFAARGNWDRTLYVATLLGETHTFSPNSEYWILYHNNNYADWGACDLHLRDGDTVLWQAGVSGASPDYIPDSVPLSLARVTPASGNVLTGGTLKVRLTEYRPTDIFGTPDPSIPGHWIIPPSPATYPAGYTVTAGSATATTDANGEATLTLRSAGLVSVQASKPGNATNWGRSVPFDVCVAARGGRC